MPKIFVPCRQSMSMYKAKQFGDLVILSKKDPKKPGYRMDLEPDRILNRFSRPMNTWEPGDFLLLDGPLAYNVVAAGIAASLYDTIKFLVWDDTKQNYVRRSLKLRVGEARKWNHNNVTMVYTVNDAHPTDAAKKFGTVKEIRSTTNKPKPLYPEKIFEDISPALKKSCKDDFLILSGDKLSNAIATAIMARRNKTVNFLLMHFKHKQYQPRTVDFSKERIRKSIK